MDSAASMSPPLSSDRWIDRSSGPPVITARSRFRTEPARRERRGGALPGGWSGAAGCSGGQAPRPTILSMSSTGRASEAVGIELEAVGAQRDAVGADPSPERVGGVAVKEAAALLGMPVSTMYDWVNRRWVRTIV